MVTKYMCIKPLILNKYDEDGRLIENEQMILEYGSTWELEEGISPNMTGIGITDGVKLTKNHMWIEIYFDDLKEHFVKVD